MRTRSIIVIMLAAILLSACYTSPGSVRGSGKVVTEQRQVSGISGVALSTSCGWPTT